MKNIYVALIRSVLKFDRIQSQTQQLCCREVKCQINTAVSTPGGSSLLEMPLQLRWKQLMVNYWANLQSHKDLYPTKKFMDTF